MRTNNQRKTVVTDSETGIAYRFSSITEARKFSGCTYYKITCCSDTGEKWGKYYFDILPADEPNDGAHLVAIEKDGTDIIPLGIFPKSITFHYQQSDIILKKETKTALFLMW